MIVVILFLSSFRFGTAKNKPTKQAFNYISNKGYARMSREDEKHWVDLMNVIHDSVKGGMKYNTGTLLMVLSRPVEGAPLPPGKEKKAGKDKTNP